MYVLYLLKRFVFLSLFRPLTCTVYIFQCFTDGPTGVWCVCTCACNYTEEAIITGRRFPRHLSPDVCEGTGHGRNLCKVNKFFLFHQDAFAAVLFQGVFFVPSGREAGGRREPCCTRVKNRSLMQAHERHHRSHKASRNYTKNIQSLHTLTFLDTISCGYN